MPLPFNVWVKGLPQPKGSKRGVWSQTQQRAVIFFAYWQDLDVTAIARLLGVSDGTVRRQLARARGRLREVLG